MVWSGTPLSHGPPRQLLTRGGGVSWSASLCRLLFKVGRPPPGGGGGVQTFPPGPLWVPPKMFFLVENASYFTFLTLFLRPLEPPRALEKSLPPSWSVVLTLLAAAVPEPGFLVRSGQPPFLLLSSEMSVCAKDMDSRPSIDVQESEPHNIHITSH